jgi:hypothetical protein
MASGFLAQNSVIVRDEFEHISSSPHSIRQSMTQHMIRGRIKEVLPTGACHRT